MEMRGIAAPKSVRIDPCDVCTCRGLHVLDAQRISAHILENERVVEYTVTPHQAEVKVIVIDL
jgi:hypothetical protein